MKFGTIFLATLIACSLLASGCGGEGDPSKVSRETYKKVILDLSDSSKGPRTLEEILAAHNIKMEDYGAAAREFSQDAAFMEEIKKITNDAMKGPPSAGETGESPTEPEIDGQPPVDGGSEPPPPETPVAPESTTPAPAPAPAPEGTP